MSFLGHYVKLYIVALCTEANYVQFGVVGVRFLKFLRRFREVGRRGAGHSFGGHVR
jgi:hypothetical protein